MKPLISATLAAGMMAGVLSGVVHAQESIGSLPQDAGHFQALAGQGFGDLDFITGEALLAVNVASSATLPPLTATELLGVGSGAVDLGTWFPGADPTAGVTPTPVVARAIDSLWTAWITGSVNRVDVQVSLVAANGQAGRLSHPLRPAITIPVTLAPREPVEIFKIRNLRLLEGGLDLTLDSSSATVAGDYEGTLIVTISQY